jgi:hypothetical protein
MIEQSLKFIEEAYGVKASLPIAKLHGSVDGRILPPTWQKIINDDELRESWTKAAEWLSEANEIRILGYSLPPTDVYMRTLFASSLMESTNLQRVDVLCLDPTEGVKNRYLALFTFPCFRFMNTDVTRYLSLLKGGCSLPLFFTGPSKQAHLPDIEVIHSQFLSSQA